MAKRRAASLTPDQKKSGIDPIYLAADNVPHIVGKLSTKATTFLQTSLQSEVFLKSYGAPKSWEYRLAGFRDSHETIGTIVTKVRAYKGACQEGSPGVTSHAPKSVKECEGTNLHTHKWAPILGVKVPMDS